MQQWTHDDLVDEWHQMRRKNHFPVWPAALLSAASVALTGLSWVWLVAVPV